MDEKQLINDIWDVLMNNQCYITSEKFCEKYGDNFIEADSDKKQIVIRNDNGEWILQLQKVWADKQ